MLKYVMIALIQFYRKYLSILKPPCCRFVPSCSEYALLAVTRYGFFKGTLLAVIRLLKCHPLHEGGYDPVPEPRIK